MRTALELPPSWRVETVGAERTLATAPDVDLAIVIEPLAPLPDDPRAWIEAALGGSGARFGGFEPTVAAAGWPMELHDVDVDGGRRLVATYRFCEYAGLAVARTADVARWPALRALAVPILRSGRPVWQGRLGVATLAELWS